MTDILDSLLQRIDDDQLRDAITTHVAKLKDGRKFGLVFEEQNALRPPSVPDQGKLWAKLLRAALMGPKELQERSWTQLEDENEALPSLTQKDPR